MSVAICLKPQTPLGLVVAKQRVEMFTSQESTEALIRSIDMEIDSAVRYATNLRQAIILLEDLQANFVQPVLAEQLATSRRNLAIAGNQIVEMQSKKNTLLEKSEQANTTPKLGSVYHLSGQ
ncbi:hypothetical protein AB3R30_12870 [Leptolyngbyaceae cyanobacterium UHCC 1019]